MKAIGLALLIFLGILLAIGLDRQLSASGSLGPSEPVPTLGPLGCEPDRDALQAAIYAYNAKYREWPTLDGKPGDIYWDRLVPDFLPYIPNTDRRCNWQVNSNPEGQVCLWEKC